MPTVRALCRGRTRRSGRWAAVALLAAIGGCGGSGSGGGQAAAPAGGSAAPPVAPAGRSAPPLVAALGDSITAGSPLWDPNPMVRAQIGPQLDRQSQFEYWAAPRLRASFRNCGVFGERTDQIALRLDACARGARYLLLQGGINDIAQGQSIAVAARNLEAMVARGQALGLRVEIVQVLPWNNGYPAAAAPILKLNGLIAQLAARHHIPVVPFYRALEDPAAPARMRADLTIDGNHPSVAGYRILAGLIRLPPVSSGQQ